MSRIIKYVIPGPPIPWKRAGHANGTFYDTQKHQKLQTGLYLSNQHALRSPFEGPLELTIVFYFPMPKSWRNKTKEMECTPHFIKADNDNLQKYVQDVASGILYHDDCLIAETHSYKTYSEVPRTEFTLSEIHIEDYKNRIKTIWEKYELHTKNNL